MPSESDIVRVLKAAPFFRSFTETGLQIVASISHERLIPAGSPLFVENTPSDGMFVIADGMIRLSVRSARGQDVTLAVLAAPDSFGEAALIRTGPRLCSANAEVPSHVLEISRRDVAALQRTKPQASLKLMMCAVDAVGERVRDVEPDLRQFLAWKLGLL